MALEDGVTDEVVDCDAVWLAVSELDDVTAGVFEHDGLSLLELDRDGVFELVGVSVREGDGVAVSELDGVPVCELDRVADGVLEVEAVKNLSMLDNGGGQ